MTLDQTITILTNALINDMAAIGAASEDADPRKVKRAAVAASWLAEIRKGNTRATTEILLSILNNVTSELTEEDIRKVWIFKCSRARIHCSDNQ